MNLGDWLRPHCWSAGREVLVIWNSPVSARPRATSCSFMFRCCEERRKRSKASSGVIFAAHQDSFGLADDISGQQGLVQITVKALKGAGRSSTVRAAIEACAAKMSPISCAVSLNA